MVSTPRPLLKATADLSVIGREYKVWTLKSKDRNDPERLYALSIDVARTVGFADSSFMLRRLPLLVKVQMTASEKEQAVEAGRVSNSLKYRSVTMIPIRNVYKYLGAKIVKGESLLERRSGRQLTDRLRRRRTIRDGRLL